ncbi:MAG: cbb3-type cytochrome c oxidase N-terminal domain-containing protein [Reichenbachiella sp.]|uniref:cbb3-type cytochrome c oxidase N-terminal domain-containing protein n=1 Tax=Reichenbachiella sp. TaxID=2184521 RepID=UPI0029675C4E|nr:cbb3-type cytochrome c oxidase N-terminal domain-containing protein [Reichenbachiella sp.]MDW3210472.1 cbb3-type cytochrome c oxidase N-terminal domain-containing protein [Reichenbachiella sp.]
MNQFKTYIKGMGAFLMLLLTGPASFAQSEVASTFESIDASKIMIVLVLVVMLLVLLVAFYLLVILQVMVREDAIRRAKEKGVEYVEEPSAWSKFYAGLTDAVPIEKEATIVLDHDYDGIKELDNHLPPWWKYMFYASIVFAVIYMFMYHISGSLPLQTQEYEIAMAEAQANMSEAEAGSTIDESNIAFSDDPAVLASGKTVYERNCVACHKAAGEGGIGPNLTDDYWLHGGSIQDIYNTIKNGVPDKGMIAWGDVLSPSKMNDVASYIETLKGTNPPNAKAPQGELYKAEVIEESPAE